MDYENYEQIQIKRKSLIKIGIMFTIVIILLFSAIIYIFAAAPTHGTPLLNSTYETNSTAENITVYNITTADADGDSVRNIYNWYRNNTPIAVLNMPFENRTDTTNATDYSGYGNNGTITTGTTWNATGGFDGKGAYTFNQLSSLNITSSSSLNASTPFTIMAWVRPTTLNGYPAIFCKGAINTEYLMFINSGAGQGANFTFRVTSTAFTVFSTTTASINNWYHVAGRYNGTNISIFVNGVNERTAPAPATITTRNTNLHIGSCNNTIAFWKGNIDEAQMYNISLSDAQILAIYNNKTNTIVGSSLSNETNLRAGDTWNASVTPNDGTGDGTTSFTTNLTILANGVPTLEPLVFNVTTLVKTTNVKVNTTYRDAEGTAGNVNFTWYRNDSVVFTENFTNIPHQTVVNSTLNSTFYNRTDLINVTVFAFDGTGSSSTINSSTLTVANTVPTHGTPLLNSTLGTNLTTENLTVYNITTADADSDGITNVVSWYRNNTPYTVVNMPFEGGTNRTFVRDYSGNEYNGTGMNLTFQNTGGHDGFGILNFTTNGATNNLIYFNLTNPGINPRFANEPFSIEAWFQTAGCNNAGNIITKCGSTANELCNYRILVRCGNGSIEFYTGDGTNWRAANANQNYLNTGWHHLVAVYDKKNSRQLIYTDNILRDNISNTLTNLRATDIISISQITPYNAMTQQFNGSLSLLRIWNDSLSSEQIKLLWDNKTTILDSSMTQRSDIWNASITPNDGTGDGVTKYSISLTIKNALPTHGIPILNSTLGTNSTTQNITVYNITTADVDNDTVTNVISWYRNNTPFLLVNMPMEGGTNEIFLQDYSNNAFNGTQYQNLVFENSSGFDGKGAINFTGTGQSLRYFNLTTSTGVSFGSGSFSIETWVLLRNVSGANAQHIISKGNATPTLQFRLRVPTSNGRIIFDTEKSVDNIATSTAAQNYFDGKWHHIVAVRDAEEQRQYLYVDNILQDNGSNTLGTLAHQTDTPIMVGMINGSLNTGNRQQFNFNGSISLLRIWNGTLSSQQIQLLWDNKTTILDSSILKVGDTWNASITPNDGTDDGVTRYSTNLTIVLGENITFVVGQAPANRSFVNGTRTINVTTSSSATTINIYIDGTNQTQCSSQTWCNLSWNTTAETPGIHGFNASALISGSTVVSELRNVSTSLNYTVNTSIMNFIFVNETSFTIAGVPSGNGELERGSYNASLNFTSYDIENVSNVYYGFPITNINTVPAGVWDNRRPSFDIATFDNRKENVTTTTNSTHVIVNMSFRNFSYGIHNVIFNFSTSAGGGGGDSPGGAGGAGGAGGGKIILKDIVYDLYVIDNEVFTVEEILLRNYSLITNKSHTMIINGIKDVYSPNSNVKIHVYTYNLEINASPANIKFLLMELNRKEDQMMLQNFEFTNVDIGHYVSESKLEGHKVGNYTIFVAAEFNDGTILTETKDIEIIKISLYEKIIDFTKNLDKRIIVVIVLLGILGLLIASLKTKSI